MPAPFTLSPVPYRPADFADWREGILTQLLNPQRGPSGRTETAQLTPDSVLSLSAVGGLSFAPFHETSHKRGDQRDHV